MNARFIISDTDLISIKEVEHTTGMKKSWIYARINKGDFPPPRKFGTHKTSTSRWVRGEIENWKRQYINL